MTARKPLQRLVAAAAISFVTIAALPAHAAPSGRASAADAYGLWVNTQLLPTKTPVRHGPVSRVSQEFPPGATGPAQSQVQQVGPLPSDGSLVNHVGVLTSMAGADGTPAAVASAQVTAVSLLKQSGGSPMITADLVRAQANSDCTNNPNAANTTFLNLKVNGTPIDQTPAPNTVIDLQVAKVILNEQRPAFDGRGIVVNAIHVISTTTGDPLFRGDIIVAHAMSTVNCTDGSGSTGESNEVKIVKSVDKDVAKAGDELVYTATISNSSSQPCLVTTLIDHLPAGFSFVSTSGDLGTSLDVVPPPSRAGGGQELMLGNGRTIAAGGSVTQQFVVTVNEGLPAGVYYNNVEIFCANIGNFVKGLDAPVQVREVVAPSEEPEPEPSEEPEPEPQVTENPGPLPHTGGGTGPMLPVAAAVLAGVALVVRRARPHHG